MSELDEKKAMVEKTALRKLIKKHGGGMNAMAADLKVHVSTVFRKLQKHGLLYAARMARAKAAMRVWKDGSS